MQKEIWVEHPTNTEGTSFTKFEVSNFGRLKIYNHLSPEGRVTNGNLLKGVPSYIYKTYKPISEKDAQKLKEFDEKYLELKNLVTKFRYQPEKLKYYRNERDKVKAHRMNFRHKVQRKREYAVVLLIHRLVAEYFLEKPKSKDKIYVIHKDFDKTNNHVDNLAWASQDEISARHHLQPKMILHKFKMQLLNIPRLPRHTKLSENDVLYIKKRLKKDDSIQKLARKFDVTPATINKIKMGKTWSHIKLVEDLVEENK